jgi:hypothetical protein
MRGFFRERKNPMYYYFAFTNDDPMRTSFRENEITLEEMKTRFIGKAIKTGEEDHDYSIVSNIWTEAQAKAYYND